MAKVAVQCLPWRIERLWISLCKKYPFIIIFLILDSLLVMHAGTFDNEDGLYGKADDEELENILSKGNSKPANNETSYNEKGKK